MKKIIVLIVICALMISACRSLDPVFEPKILITDALSRDVTLEDVPRNIVVAGRQTPMLVNFLYMFEDISKNIAAIENRSQSGVDFLEMVDPFISEKYILERGASAEQIAPINPDLVILKTTMKESLGDQLETLSIPVLYVSLESVEEIYRDIAIIGGVLGQIDRANEIISYYQEKFSDIQVTIDETIHKPEVLVIQAVDENQTYTFRVPAQTWLQTNLIELAGGLPVWKDGGVSGGWNDINFEQIAEWNPDHIFIINYQGLAVEIQENLQSNTLWKDLEAVKNNQISAFPYDFLSWDQPDPRWILGYRWIAEEIQPESHFRQDLMEIVEEFYEFIFNVSETQIDSLIIPAIVK